jgi:hypothetical protein
LPLISWATLPSYPSVKKKTIPSSRFLRIHSLPLNLRSSKCCIKVRGQPSGLARITPPFSNLLEIRPLP